MMRIDSHPMAAQITRANSARAFMATTKMPPISAVRAQF